MQMLWTKIAVYLNGEAGIGKDGNGPGQEGATGKDRRGWSPGRETVKHPGKY